ncbi:MAG: TonB-dependent receptor [Candidatus Omnitrophota bacterium]
MLNSKKLAKAVGILMLVFFSISVANAQEGIELEKIIVTPYRYSEDISKTASFVTNITQNDIKNSNAQKIIDVLRPVTGLVVRDWYGNGSKASVDIRGFGEQANLNVLVLINGRRVNEVDLSGVDWSQIPLDQIERIEIIRGGSGGVLYGDNAQGGVINIITKKGKGEPLAHFAATYGSYDLNAQELFLSGSTKSLSYFLSSSREGTHGYRNNSFYKSQDFYSNLGYDLNEDAFLRFNSGYHKSNFGLPASLKQDVIDEFSRRYARKSDRANEEDYYFLLGGKKEWAGTGELDTDVSYRRRRANSYFPTDGLYTLRSAISTIGITPKYILTRQAFGHDNKLITGLDHYLWDYCGNSYDAVTDQLQNFTDTNKMSLAGYLRDEFYILDNLVFSSGYRYEAAKFEFDYHDNSGWNPDIDKNANENQEAFDAGLVYEYAKDSSIFITLSRSFRFPAVDEFTYNDASWQQQLNPELKPQSSLNYDLGIRHRFSECFKLNLSGFLMRLKDELYFNSTGGPTGFGQNLNYDRTIHEGLEFGFEARPRKEIILSGNYSFVRAIFDGGEFDKSEIPLVSRHKGGLGLRVLFPNSFTLNILANYVGKRYCLNDQANAFSRLNGYLRVDANIDYRFKDLTVTFCVNNILNKKYSEFAGVDHTDNQKFYYPSPERNFSLKLEYSF